jgi:hypothetical protein
MRPFRQRVHRLERDLRRGEAGRSARRKVGLQAGNRDEWARRRVIDDEASSAALRVRTLRLTSGTAPAPALLIASVRRSERSRTGDSAVSPCGEARVRSVRSGCHNRSTSSAAHPLPAAERGRWSLARCAAESRPPPRPRLGRRHHVPLLGAGKGRGALGRRAGLPHPAGTARKRGFDPNAPSPSPCHRRTSDADPLSLAVRTASHGRSCNRSAAEKGRATRSQRSSSPYSLVRPSEPTSTPRRALSLPACDPTESRAHVQRRIPLSG